jgi:hypothetical protein
MLSIPKSDMPITENDRVDHGRRRPFRSQNFLLDSVSCRYFVFLLSYLKLMGSALPFYYGLGLFDVVRSVKSHIAETHTHKSAKQLHSSQHWSCSPTENLRRVYCTTLQDHHMRVSDDWYPIISNPFHLQQRGFKR